MEIFIIATKNCSHYPNMVKQLASLGYECDVKFVEENADLVAAHNIRNSPNLIINNKVAFRSQPSDDELQTALNAAKQ